MPKLVISIAFLFLVLFRVVINQPRSQGFFTFFTNRRLTFFNSLSRNFDWVLLVTWYNTILKNTSCIFKSPTTLKNIKMEDHELCLIIVIVMRNACNIVRKCVENRLCEIFNGYFEKIEHSVRTRNSNCLRKLHKVKLDVAKNCFYFMGAKFYNSLPISIRKEGKYSKFKLLWKNRCF